MSGKRINAHITIMAALSMTIVLSLISTCIKSASDCYYNTQIKEACMLSVEAAFSSYHNDMLNEYDIFLLENTDRIETKIEKYVEKNLSSCGKDISLLGINVDNIEHMTDKGGIYLKKEIARYMQYEIYGDMLENLLLYLIILSNQQLMEWFLKRLCMLMRIKFIRV